VITPPALLPSFRGSSRVGLTRSYGCRYQASKLSTCWPYRVNLTPFAGLLSDGQPPYHRDECGERDQPVQRDRNLLLFEDHGSKQVTGEVTLNTIQSPNPVVTTNLQVDGSNVHGTVNTTSQPRFQLAGFSNTSHGKVNRLIEQDINFSNLPKIQYQRQCLAARYFPAHAGEFFRHHPAGWESSFSKESFLYPLTVDIKLTANQTVQTTTISQEFQHIVVSPGFVSGVDHVVHANDTLNFNTGVNTNASSSQRYTSGNSLGQIYDCEIRSRGNVLKAVAKSCDQTIQFK